MCFSSNISSLPIPLRSSVFFFCRFDLIQEAYIVHTLYSYYKTILIEWLTVFIYRRHVCGPARVCVSHTCIRAYLKNRTAYASWYACPNPYKPWVSNYLAIRMSWWVWPNHKNSIVYEQRHFIRCMHVEYHCSGSSHFLSVLPHFVLLVLMVVHISIRILHAFLWEVSVNYFPLGAMAHDTCSHDEPISEGEVFSRLSLSLVRKDFEWLINGIDVFSKIFIINSTIAGHHSNVFDTLNYLICQS